MDAPEKTDLERVEDDLLAFLKEKLADKTIKAMESKLLLEILNRRELPGGGARKGVPMPSLEDDLPFQSDTRIVS